MSLPSVEYCMFFQNTILLIKEGRNTHVLTLCLEQTVMERLCLKGVRTVEF